MTAPLLTPRTVARRLGVSARTVARLVNSGALVAFQIRPRDRRIGSEVAEGQGFEPWSGFRSNRFSKSVRRSLKPVREADGTRLMGRTAPSTAGTGRHTGYRRSAA